MGLVAGIVAPKVMSYFGDSKVKAARLEIETIATAVGQFKLDTGRYPDTQEGLESLLQEPFDISGWNGPYLDHRSQIMDPWDNQYSYEYSGPVKKYRLVSLGADNSFGGDGKDIDIIYEADQEW